MESMSRRWISAEELEKIEKKCLKLFKGTDFSAILTQLRAKIINIPSDTGFYDYFSVGEADLFGELTKDGIVIEKIGEEDEKSKNAILSVLAKALLIAAAKMEIRGRAFLEKQSKSDMDKNPYYIYPNKIAEQIEEDAGK